jgi:hypothetical protein
MHVPAVCNTCGTIFPSGFVAEGASNITFSDCGAGPCPRCGGMGHIPDGVYNFIGNTIELLSGQARTRDELQRLGDLLRKARTERLSVDQIKEKIIAEVPEISSLKDILPKTKGELYPFLGIVITVIGMLLGQLKCPDRSKVEVSQVVNIIYQQVQEPLSPPVTEVEKRVPKLAIPKTK